MGHRKHKEDYPLPIDVRVDLFRNILHDSRYQAWKHGYRRWRLHISGGPGSGKTTLAALIARQLHEQKIASVALVHVHDDLASIANQNPLAPISPLAHNRDLQSNKFTFENGSLITGVINISSLGTDAEDLRLALANQLRRSGEVCLIVDGYDRIQHAAQQGFRRDLDSLQAQGLRVLLFSAASELDAFPPAWPVTCDDCGRGSEDEAGLHIYWACELCPCDLCDTCRAAGKHCRDYSHTMSEPYDYINMKLAPAPSELEAFVRADLGAEYGTSIEDNVIEAVCEPSDGNINLAKLRLDQIRDFEAPSDILLPVDRLPREVVAFFDAEVKRINFLEPTQRYQTLIAIIAVATAGWISVSKLEELLKSASSFAPDRNTGRYPFVRRVLSSARGLLSSMIFRGSIRSDHQDSDRHRVALYVRDLGYYIREDYNQDLVLAKQYLSQARTGERNLDRSYSFEITVGGRKEEVNGTGRTPAPSLDSNEEVSGVSNKTIIEAISQEPGDICPTCWRTMLQGTSNSGTRSWINNDPVEQCPICLYAYEELTLRPLNGALDVRWARRTMGRTSNSNNHLVLTLRVDDSSINTTCRRFVFMLKSELGPIPSLNGLGRTTTLPDSGKQIRKWIQICKTEHIHCNLQKTESYIPKRLVDIDTGISGQFRVIGKEQKVEGPYVTLSHSWGRDPNFLMLTTENKHELMAEGFSALKLRNKNFKEAIEVAQHLGVRYIWIDSLCICQAGRDKDFKEEGQYMHLVYQNSFCNIVAADSRDAQGGLFRDRSDVSLSGANTTGSWVVLDKELWAKDLLQSPIYTRGWVFQERMLSPRIIHFTRSQVFWDCSALSACETLPRGLPFALSALATTDRRWRGRLQRKNSDQGESKLAVEDSLESFWKTAVLNYTSCELTNQADKTFAIWSVAKLVRDNLQLIDQYGCGLWAIGLHEQLAWQVKVSKQDARMDALQSVFPSWSWASVNAPVQIQDRIVAKRCYTIKNHKGNPLSFGEFNDKGLNRDMQPQFAASDSLAVRGHLIPGQLARDPSGGTYTIESTQTGLSLKYEVVMDESPSEALLKLSNIHFLPLVARKMTEDEGTYAGSALVLIATRDYRQLARSRLMHQILRLVLSYGCHLPGSKTHKHWKSELRTLRIGINTLNACLHKVARQDRELPSRGDNAFRRVGVVHFSALAATEWASIRAISEEMVWLD